MRFEEELREVRKILCVGGARPNFMKLAPLLAELEASDRYSPLLAHTGQHYDEKMSGSFFRDLGMRDPDYSLGVGSGSHAQQTAEVMKRFEPVVEAAGRCLEAFDSYFASRSA